MSCSNSMARRSGRTLLSPACVAPTWNSGPPVRRCIPLSSPSKGERKPEFPDHPRVVGRRIDADAGELRPPAFELLELPGVAGQLPVAVGGPVAPVEDQHHGSHLQLAREAPGIVLLIRQLEVCDLLPDIQSGHVMLLPLWS